MGGCSSESGQRESAQIEADNREKGSDQLTLAAELPGFEGRVESL